MTQQLMEVKNNNTVISLCGPIHELTDDMKFLSLTLTHCQTIALEGQITEMDAKFLNYCHNTQSQPNYHEIPKIDAVNNAEFQAIINKWRPRESVDKTGDDENRHQKQRQSLNLSNRDFMDYDHYIKLFFLLPIAKFELLDKILMDAIDHTLHNQHNNNERFGEQCFTTNEKHFAIERVDVFTEKGNTGFNHRRICCLEIKSSNTNLHSKCSNKILSKYTTQTLQIPRRMNRRIMQPHDSTRMNYNNRNQMVFNNLNIHKPKKTKR